ncbi:type II toxin-antitoxin system RelE/ParE family toxin [Aridibaculum aurantiacum]|uniref:type II toxin-antitoxin system RelE/ParE family toxin n=1 Tax=Aridibaculum aurantiacum TaxID=2810307 RepID=UPI001A978914|nr:type II toxin-antitoxin system RelE/ParE family toxin [Aridibaculum aurantiacum]
MAVKVVWTVDGTRSFQDILEYLLLNFSEKEAHRFFHAVEAKLKLAQSNPMMYRQSARFPNVHVTVVLKKVLLVYRYKQREQIIEVLVCWDGRRDPKKFKF